MEIGIESIVGIAFGGSLVLFLAKFVIQKSLNDLDKIADKISCIRSELAAISVRLEMLEKHDELLEIHNQKILAIENRLISPNYISSK